MGKTSERVPFTLTVRNLRGDELGSVVIADPDWGTFHAYCTTCDGTARRPSSIAAALTWIQDHQHADQAVTA